MLDDLIVVAHERPYYGFVNPRAFFGSFVGREHEQVGLFLWPFDAECRGYDMSIWKGPYQFYGYIAPVRLL